MGDNFENEGVCVGGRAGLAARRAAQLPKLKDLVKKQRPESVEDFNANTAEPDLEFDYGDCDSYSNELAELFSYSELDEFSFNAEAYLEYSLKRQLPKEWKDLSIDHQKTIALDLVEELELCDRERRMKAVRTFLYLLQGSFLDCKTDRECLWSCVRNAYLLYDVGVFYALCTVLSIELGPLGDQELRTTESLNNLSVDQDSESKRERLDSGNNPAKDNRRRSVCMTENSNLRLILTALYMIVEAVRRRGIGELGAATSVTDTEFKWMKAMRERFQTDLGLPLCGDQSLTVTLFQMVTKFCAGTSPHFPMRKVLLLLWKTLLSWLGGWEDLKRRKNEARQAINLSIAEDTLTVARTMRAAAPPSVLPLMAQAMATDNVDGTPNRARARPPMARRQLACMRSSDSDEKAPEAEDEDITDQMDPGGLAETEAGDDSAFEPPQERLPDDPRPGAATPVPDGMATPRPGSPTEPQSLRASMDENSGGFPPKNPQLNLKTLPWKPKIRPQEVETFLDNERSKFFGFQLPEDGMTTAGLPQPIFESLKALKKHVYVSLGEVQAKRDEELNRYCFSQKEDNISDTPAEQLYRSILPEIPQHMIALLKILLSAQPSSKAKTDAINILSDVLPPGTDPALTASSSSLSRDLEAAGLSGAAGLEQSLRISIDINRHKEVIVKAAAAIVLLLLKHMRLNHVYQFEYISQHLVFANCIPLILKFFDQNIQQYAQSRNELAAWNFPGCVIYYGEHDHMWPELNLENIERDPNPPGPSGACSRPGTYFLWRNVFSAINLLRVLNKLTKWKHARTMMLVVFKSAPIMKRALRVKHILLQLYALKLLKMQAKHLGRQWRKTNMEIMSAIYSKVRHRLNDDWAYGNETQSKAFDFQSEESSLRNAIEKFHLRRYGEGLTSSTASSMTGSGGLAGGGETSNGGASGGGGVCVWALNDPDFLPFDNNVVSVLGSHYELTDRFKVNYGKWLEREVFKATIDWDQVLALNRGK